MDEDRLTRLIEFFIVGIVLGVTEDLLAILLATDAEINLQVIGVILIVAFPFAIISEFIVDSEQFDFFDRIVHRLIQAGPGSFSGDQE